MSSLLECAGILGLLPTVWPSQRAVPGVLFATMVVSLRLYWIGYRNAPPQSVQQKRFKAFFIAFVVAYFGSVDYLAAYGIPFYPSGYLPVFAWFVIVAFAIRRYHLFDITPSFAAYHILTMMADALLVLDRQGVVRVVNRAACRLLGKAEAALVGMSITAISSQFFTPQQVESLVCDGGVYTYEIRLPVEEGEIRVLSVSASWIPDHTNQPVGMTYITQDITERKREILPLIAEGKTNREIAVAVSLSENSVKTYVSNILQKLHLARRAEAAAFIARRGSRRQTET